MSALAEVGALLRAVGVEYALIGGHAVNAWLEPRLTGDIDVTVVADKAVMNQIKVAFDGAGYQVARELGRDLPSGPDFVRFVSADGVRIIELQAAKTPLQERVVKRAVSAGGIAVATPEDLIVLKLIANRTKDQSDLHGLIRLPALDWSYIEREAADWGVTAVLERLRARG